MKKLWLNYWGKSGIKVSVYFIITLIVLSGGSSMFQRQTVAERDEIRNDMERIRYLGDKYNLTLLWADVGFRGFFMIQEDNFLAPFEQAKVELVTDNDEMKSLLTKYEFDGTKIDFLTTEMQGYFEMLDNLVVEKSNGNDSIILETFRADPGLVLYRATVPTIQEVNAFTHAKEDTVTSTYASVTKATTLFQFILILLGLPTLVQVVIRITRNERRRNAMFSKLEESNQKYIFSKAVEENEDDSTDETEVINDIVLNLQKATDFIQNITKGNYEIRWEGMTDEVRDLNQTNISGELIKMRDQMIKVKSEDEIRLWVTEGTSKFAEIVRTHENNIAELGDIIVSEIVKYVKANQGALFLLNEDDEEDTYIELVSCYAYERKKFLNKRIEIGQTIVGQVFLEAKTTLLTEVPENYVSISSGLGDASPRSLIIVPMIFKEKVEGVIEIASFRKFEPHEIDLLEKLAQIIASSINSLKTNQKTKLLLENSTQQTEEMRAQEEEMMQNMEELQATQEEMKRKTEEYETLIQENEKELKVLRELKANDDSSVENEPEDQLADASKKTKVEVSEEQKQAAKDKSKV